jgi:Amt family ammonium transporter
MFMAAGFCMLEVGLVRQRNAATIALKNLAIYAIAGLAYFGIGYGLMYVLPEGAVLIGIPGLWAPKPLAEINGAYASSADWFFQMAFVATTASIVSGALAERIRLWPFLGFSLILAGVIYPIVGAWTWGGGWLADLGFKDFAGSTVVHSVGGWAALIGAIVLGARIGRFAPDGTARAMPGSNLPLAALGAFILWFGWFGFNGGSRLAFASPEDVNAVAKIIANTNLSAAAGVVAAMLLSQLRHKRIDILYAINGAIGGLVAITAEPLTPAPLLAVAIGAVGGVLVVYGADLLERLRIDDVVGAVPAHLFCGIWGTLAVPLSNPQAAFGTQVLGVLAVAGFGAGAAGLVWLGLSRSVGIRAGAEAETLGLDRAEGGVEAYPEFAKHGP